MNLIEMNLIELRHVEKRPVLLERFANFWTNLGLRDKQPLSLFDLNVVLVQDIAEFSRHRPLGPHDSQSSPIYADWPWTTHLASRWQPLDSTCASADCGRTGSAMSSGWNWFLDQWHQTIFSWKTICGAIGDEVLSCELPNLQDTEDPITLQVMIEVVL